MFYRSLSFLGVTSTSTTPINSTNSKRKSPLSIPGPMDVAVNEYSEWQESNVTNHTLKAEFQQARDITLAYGLNLEQVYKDQDPGFFVSKGIKIGIARRFVDNIRN